MDKIVAFGVTLECPQVFRGIFHVMFSVRRPMIWELKQASGSETPSECPTHLHEEKLGTGG